MQHLSSSLVLAEVLQHGGQIQAVDGQAVHNVLLDDQPAERLQGGDCKRNSLAKTEGAGVAGRAVLGEWCAGLTAGSWLLGSMWGILCCGQHSSSCRALLGESFTLWSPHAVPRLELL